MAFTRSYANNFSAGAQYDLDQVEGFTTTGGLSNSMAYLYDANGNRSNTPWSLYIHDSRNRLTTIGSWVQSGGGWNPPSTGTWSSWSMRYDPDGRRIQLTSTLSDNLDFVHAGDMEIADIRSSNGRITRRYVPGASIDERVAMIVTTGGACSPVCPTAHREYYHNDRQGNVIAMAHQNGTRTAQYVYTPFGVEEPYSASGQPFRYTGQRRDGETGLYYYRARYYDPALGRFLQTDPVLYADQMNLYAYVGNNPLNATDPTGRQTAKVQGGGSIAGVRGQAVRGNIGVVFGRDDRGRASAALFVSRGFGVGVPNTAGASGGIAVCVSCTMSDVEGRSVSAEAGAVGNVSVDVSTIESNIIAAFDGNSNTSFNPGLVEVAVEAGVGNFVGGSYNQTDIIASVTVPNDINVSGTSEGDLVLTYTSPADEGARSFSFRDLLNGYRSEERYPTRDPM